MFPGFRERTHHHNPIGLNSPAKKDKQMKLLKSSNLFAFALLVAAVAGCKKTPVGVTQLPSYPKTGPVAGLADSAIGGGLKAAEGTDLNAQPIIDPNVRQN